MRKFRFNLTIEQMQWLLYREIKTGKAYMFPRFGFTVYDKPSYASDFEKLDTNPFTKSLDHHRFLVKEEVNGFFRGNFERRPLSSDFYISVDEMSSRGTLEWLFLLTICYIPMVIYNYFTKEKQNQYAVQYGEATGTVCVHASTGETVGRFSRRFGMDIHTSVEQQMAGKSQCLHCTHGKPTDEDLETFVSKAKELWGVKIDTAKF